MPSKQALNQKKEEVKGLKERFESSIVGVFVDYRGISVEQDTELRKQLRESGTTYNVIKNRMAKFAIKETELEGLEEALTGPTSLATHETDLIAPAKILAKFIKDNEDVISIKAGFLEGKVVDTATIAKLATLPSKEELIAKVLGSLNSPIAGFANVLNANITGLVRALDAVRAQKEAA